MKKSCYILFFLLVGFSATSKAQIRIFKPRSQAERASRDLERRLRRTPQFNPLQPMGTSASYIRDDYIWSSETAYTTHLNAGNVSLLTSSRWGLTDGYELKTLLGADFWVPNLFIKKRWYHQTYYWSSQHGFYTSIPGLNWAQNRGYQSVVDSLSPLPNTVSVKNELIVSRPFYNIFNCNSKIPYLIITAALSVDCGIPLNSNKLAPSSEHIIGTRHPTLTGNGLLVGARVQIDGSLLDDLYLRGHVKYLKGQIGYEAFENQVFLEYLITHRFSISAGYFLSVSKYASSTVAIFPFADFTFYFGSKPKRESGLFKDQMF